MISNSFKFENNDNKMPKPQVGGSFSYNTNNKLSSILDLFGKPETQVQQNNGSFKGIIPQNYHNDFFSTGIPQPTIADTTFKSIPINHTDGTDKGEEEEEEWSGFEGAGEQSNQINSNEVQSMTTVEPTPNIQFSNLPQRANTQQITINQETQIEEKTMHDEQPTDDEDWGEFKGETDGTPMKETPKEDLNLFVETTPAKANESKKMNILDLFDSKQPVKMLNVKSNEVEQHSEEEWGEFESSNQENHQEVVKEDSEQIVPKPDINQQPKSQKRNILEMYEKFEKVVVVEKIETQKKSTILDLFNQIPSEPAAPVTMEKVNESFANEEDWGEFEGNNDEAPTIEIEPIPSSHNVETSRNDTTLNVEQPLDSHESDEEWGEFEGKHDDEKIVNDDNIVNDPIQPPIAAPNPIKNILDLFGPTTVITAPMNAVNEDDGVSCGKNEVELQSESQETKKFVAQNDSTNVDHESIEVSKTISNKNILDLFEEKTNTNNQEFDDEEDWGGFEGENDRSDEQKVNVESEPQEIQTPNVSNGVKGILDLFDKEEPNIHQPNVDTPVLTVKPTTNSFEEDEEWSEFEAPTESTTIQTIESPKPVKHNILDLFDDSETKSTIIFKSTNLEIKTEAQHSDDEWGDFEGENDEKESKWDNGVKTGFNLDDLIQMNHEPVKETKFKGILDLFGDEKKHSYDQKEQKKATEMLNSLIKQERYDDAMNLTKSNEFTNHHRKRLDPISQNEMIRYIQLYINDDDIVNDFMSEFNMDEQQYDIESGYKWKMNSSSKFDQLFEQHNFKIRLKIQSLRELEKCYKFLESLNQNEKKVVKGVLESDEMVEYLKGIKIIYLILNHFEDEKLNEFKDYFETTTQLKIDTEQENLTDEELKICCLSEKQHKKGDKFCNINGNEFYVPALNFWKFAVSATIPHLK